MHEVEDGQPRNTGLPGPCLGFRVYLAHVHVVDNHGGRAQCSGLDVVVEGHIHDLVGVKVYGCGSLDSVTEANMQHPVHTKEEERERESEGKSPPPSWRAQVHVPKGSNCRCKTATATVGDPKPA